MRTLSTSGATAERDEPDSAILCDRGAVDAIAVGRARRVQRAAARPAESPAASYRPRSGRISLRSSAPESFRFVCNAHAVDVKCDRSAVGASGFRDPRVARLLAALAHARPTAAMKHSRALTPALRPFHSRGDAAGVWGTITSTAPRSRTTLPLEGPRQYSAGAKARQPTA